MTRKYSCESVTMPTEVQHIRPDVTPYPNNKRRTKY